MKNFILIAALVLSGCKVTVVQPPSASSTPSPVPTPTPVSTPSPSPTPLPTPTPSPVPTSSPVPTPSPTPLPTPTPIPTSSPSPNPSPIPSVPPFTDLKPSADTRIIYVSSAIGKDTNDGLTTKSPVATILKASSLVRTKFPDWMLLRRGDKWVDQQMISDPVGLSWNKSGRSASEPLVISSYSDPDAPSSKRPEVTSIATVMHTWALSHVFVVGINFHSSKRDPYSPDYAYPAGVVTVAPGGIILGGPTTDFLVEDCVIDSYAQGLTLDAEGDQLYPMSNVRIRYNIVRNIFSNNRSQGLYAGAIHDLLIEGNIFDHNGWTEKTDVTKTWNFMAQNHNVYLRQDNTGVVVKNNVFANGADCGLEARAGGLIQDNLFIRNQCGMTFGLVNGATLLKGGIRGEVSGNVLLDARGDASGASCLGIGNIAPGGTRIHDNICAREFIDPNKYGYAFMLEAGNGVSNPLDGVGINDLTIENNIVYAWSNGFYREKDFVPGGTGVNSFKNLIVQNNDIQNSLKRLTQIESPVNKAYETFQNNRYYQAGTPILQLGASSAVGTTTDLATWQAKLEPQASLTQVNYQDPDHSTVEAFNLSKGGPGTYEAFMADLETQGKLGSAPKVPQVLSFLKDKFKVVPKGMNLGINLGSLSYYGDDAEFADVANMTAGWWAFNNNRQPAEIVPMGWTALNYPTTDAQSLSYMLGYPTGVYKILWEHDGNTNLHFAPGYQEVAMTNQVDVVNPASGLIESTAFAALKGDVPLSIRVERKDPKNSKIVLNHLHIIAPQADASGKIGYDYGVYRQVFLDKLKPFSTIRLMGFHNTNDESTDVGKPIDCAAFEWADRTLPETFGRHSDVSHGPGRAGGTYEESIAMAEESGKDLWVNIPDCASDDFILQMAKFFHQNLPKTTRVYVEFSNEVWNWGFGQIKHVIEQTKTNKVLTATDDYSKVMQQVAFQTKKISDIWKKEFGADSAQVKTVLAGQVANSWTISSGLDFLKVTYGDTKSVDFLAGAPYADIYDADQAVVDAASRAYDTAKQTYLANKTDANKAAMDAALEAALQAIFKGMHDSETNYILPWLKTAKAMSDKYGIPYTAYESGQSLTSAWNSFVAPKHINDDGSTSTNQTIYYLFEPKRLAQLDPRMGEAYNELYQNWATIIGKDNLNCHLDLVSTPNNFGFWGLYTNINQAHSVKGDAILKLISGP